LGGRGVTAKGLYSLKGSQIHQDNLNRSAGAVECQNRGGEGKLEHIDPPPLSLEHPDEQEKQKKNDVVLQKGSKLVRREPTGSCLERPLDKKEKGPSAKVTEFRSSGKKAGGEEQKRYRRLSREQREESSEIRRTGCRKTREKKAETEEEKGQNVRTYITGNQSAYNLNGKKK